MYTMWTNHTSHYLQGGLGDGHHYIGMFWENTHFVNFSGLTYAPSDGAYDGAPSDDHHVTISVLTEIVQNVLLICM